MPVLLVMVTTLCFLCGWLVVPEWQNWLAGPVRAMMREVDYAD